MRRPQILVALIVALMLATPATAADWAQWHWRSLDQPCGGDCAVLVFGGQSVNSNVKNIFFKGIPPWQWGYDEGSFLGVAASRRVVTLFDFVTFEAEIGAGKRFGNQHEGEFWGAIYGRISKFPWNDYIVTTIALSTGLNYATGISEFEKEHSGLTPPDGVHVLHYFAPEITFALPAAPDKQLVVRLQHRSGAFGVVSNANSGATYLTGGFRFWF
jgi:hypothetical protein